MNNGFWKNAAKALKGTRGIQNRRRLAGGADTPEVANERLVAKDIASIPPLGFETSPRDELARYVGMMPLHTPRAGGQKAPAKPASDQQVTFEQSPEMQALMSRQEEDLERMEELLEEGKPERIEPGVPDWRAVVGGIAVAALARLLGAHPDEVEEGLIGYAQGLLASEDKKYQSALLAEQARQEHIKSQIGILGKKIEVRGAQLGYLSGLHLEGLRHQIRQLEVEANREHQKALGFGRDVLPALLGVETPEMFETLWSQYASAGLIPEGVVKPSPKEIEAIAEYNKRANQLGKIRPHVDAFHQVRQFVEGGVHPDVAVQAIAPLYVENPEGLKMVRNALMPYWYQTQAREYLNRNKPYLDVLRDATKQVYIDVNGRPTFMPLTEVRRLAESIQSNLDAGMEAFFAGYSKEDVDAIKAMIDAEVDFYVDSALRSMQFMHAHGMLPFKEAIAYMRYREIVRHNQVREFLQQKKFNLDADAEKWQQLEEKASVAAQSARAEEAIKHYEGLLREMDKYISAFNEALRDPALDPVARQNYGKALSYLLERRSYVQTRIAELRGMRAGAQAQARALGGTQGGQRAQQGATGMPFVIPSPPSGVPVQKETTGSSKPKK